MKRYFKGKFYIITLLLAVMFGMNSCSRDLQQEPITEETAASLYSNFSNYRGLLAKLYGGFAIGGQAGGDGNGDIANIDGGFSVYYRLYFTLQEITTDEAVIAWNDGTLHEFHELSYEPANEFINAMYYRIYTEIAFCNEFLRNTTDEQLAKNNITGDDLTEAKAMRGEARFLRAQSYYHLLDLFGTVPFVDETTLGTVPKPISRADLFNYVEAQLKQSADEMKAPRTNEYGRVDKAAAWTLLARLYLNSEVYNGTNHYNDVITYTNMVINAGYSLNPNYSHLFMLNNKTERNEIIYAIPYDGQRLQTNGGTTYMVHAAVGGSMDPAAFGINSGWGGLRVTKPFVQRFAAGDKRGNFYTNGQSLDINSIGNFNDGYAFIKYKNLSSTGQTGDDNNFVSTDLVIYRLADVYLMYAEAVLRGGNGSMSTALQYVNALRDRAYGNTSGEVASITLPFILDERSRELSWEMTRRTDLIRFGEFTSAKYLWPWKGNVKGGAPVESYRDLFPIPANELSVNSNLRQNPGY